MRSGLDNLGFVNTASFETFVNSESYVVRNLGFEGRYFNDTKVAESSCGIGGCDTED